MLSDEDAADANDADASAADDDDDDDDDDEIARVGKCCAARLCGLQLRTNNIRSHLART